MADTVSELLPCPFCGAAGELTWYDGFPSIHCKSCRSGTGMMTSGKKQDAIAAWNTRASTQPAPAFPREEVAKIIDPRPFRGWQSMYDYCLRQGDDEATARSYADQVEKPDCDKAFEKADAIAALLQGKQP